MKSAVIHKLIEELRQVAQGHRDQSARELQLAIEKDACVERLSKLLHTGRWRDVHKVRLQRNEVYLIRRAFGREKRPPAVAVWKDRWDVVLGEIHALATRSDASIEVWS
jgi:hypothetical protein